MINKNDIEEVELEASWHNQSLKYALQSWTSTFNRMGKPNPYSRIEKILIGLMAEKGVEYYLKQEGIDLSHKGKTRWYEKDRYDIGIGKYEIDIKSNFLDLNKTHIQRKYNNLFMKKYEWFLRCHALIPLDQFNKTSDKAIASRKKKVYIFPFVEGEFKKNLFQDNSKLVHAFWDYRWLKKVEFKELDSLGKLSFKYKDFNKNAKLKIYGTSEPKKACVEVINLTHNTVKSKNEYHQIFSIEWLGKSKPTATLKIRSQNLKLEARIEPDCNFEFVRDENNKYKPSKNNWQNLKIYNKKLYLLGWIKDSSVRIKGQEFKRFAKNIEQYSETKVDNWGCRINELNPLLQIKKL